MNKLQDFRDFQKYIIAYLDKLEKEEKQVSPNHNSEQGEQKSGNKK